MAAAHRTSTKTNVLGAEEASSADVSVLFEQAFTRSSEESAETGSLPGVTYPSEASKPRHRCRNTRARLQPLASLSCIKTFLCRVLLFMLELITLRSRKIKLEFISSNCRLFFVEMI